MLSRLTVLLILSARRALKLAGDDGLNPAVAAVLDGWGDNRGAVTGANLELVENRAPVGVETPDPTTLPDPVGVTGPGVDTSREMVA